MWLIVAFDVPMTTAASRKHYTRFRKRLLQDGFWQLQWSLYWKPFPMLRQAEAYLAALHPHVPPGGRVHGIFITDRQMGMLRYLYGPCESRRVTGDADYHYDPHRQYDLL
ncbi:MAG: CRISPR-associated endonuclease Cas2 [Stenotrophomonas sp.]|nr:CRISPR-associated endonuclease Cas2 [Xanthomonadales bacterium]MBN8769147.1 CRISPR-associated endonuclease Cas2 [Stenotrophomonas sp.]